MIRDRGSIKWQGMMLPEHVAEITDWRNEQYYEERPQLDDLDLQSIQEEIEAAHKRRCQVLIITWKDGEFMMRGGIIVEINIQSMCIFLDNPFGIERIAVSDIVGAQIKE
ncbi:YolD-like family protein [Sporosarcina sp. FSL K6-3457]|uniref:YolD-like family protein n=1 Tax=Sporosarcina sp. FSL K6-3457 TaxID=2978204 RepID=UPI0030F54E63